MSDTVGNIEPIVALTVDIVVAYLRNNSIEVADMIRLIESVHRALGALRNEGATLVAESKPAVSIRASVKPDHIVCLEDGRKLKTLKRHLMTHYQMTPEAYRAKWKLPADYPMVAPEYAEQRRALARKIGLGTRRRRD